MAAIDYGAIAFKNGKLISTSMYTPMIDTVGWEDTESDVYHNWDTDTDIPVKLTGNYFVYVGDSNYTLAFYKEQIVIVSRYDDGTFRYSHEYFNGTNYTWSKWEDYVGGSRVTVTKRNGYLVCKWNYNGDKYKVYFGYGVDLHYYKNCRMVNYYRSPKCLMQDFRSWIRDKVDDWKWKHGRF